MSIMPSTDQEDLIIGLEYDSTGLAWCRLWDCTVLGWYVVEPTAGKPLTTDPFPIIVGGLALPPTTAPIVSPQWAHVRRDKVVVPDQFRGYLVEFFAWLATNNGASRELRSDFLGAQTSNAFSSWASVR